MTSGPSFRSVLSQARWCTMKDLIKQILGDVYHPDARIGRHCSWTSVASNLRHHLISIQELHDFPKHDMGRTTSEKSWTVQASNGPSNTTAGPLAMLSFSLSTRMGRLASDWRFWKSGTIWYDPVKSFQLTQLSSYNYVLRIYENINDHDK